MNSVSYNLDLLPDDIKDRIEHVLEEILPKIIEAILLRDVKIVFNIDVNQTILETGVGGVTENPHCVIISLDLNHENVVNNLEEEVKGTVVHELHHAMRNRVYPWPGTLLDDIVGEGLADHFDIEINGSRDKPWTSALSENELVEYRKLVEPNFGKQNSEEDYFRWVLGFNDESIPNWAGYALGFKLVESYLEKTGRKPSELVNISSEEFVK
jgi:uncharacterized protein YjaZ